MPWLDAFDVRDFVPLVHPLGTFYSGTLRDERTHNPSDRHSLQDHLAEPDVGPADRAGARRPYALVKALIGGPVGRDRFLGMARDPLAVVAITGGM